MRSYQNGVGLILAGALSLVSLSALAEEEILLGRTAAGQLKVVIDFAQPVELEPSIFPGITGYATGEMGVHSTIFDDVANDFLQVSLLADFRLILLAKDPGMEVWDDHGMGFMATNDAYYVGVAPFDTHPLWNIVNPTSDNIYSLTLRVHDVNGIYPDSAPFALSFTPLVRRSIQIQPVDAQHATLLWTTNSVGWELQSATSVTAANWDTVTNVPAIAGTNFSLSLTTTEPQQFFRLQKL